jgi:hypothetical protein
MFVNVAKRSIYSDPVKNQNTLHCTKHTEAFMIYLFEWKTLMNVILSKPKTPKQHSKVNRQKGFCKRYMRLMLWSNIAPLEIFLCFLFGQKVAICTLN